MARGRRHTAVGKVQYTMDRFHRIYTLHNILAGRRTPVSRKALEERMECSRATVMRTIECLRDELGAPIHYDTAGNGYCYAEEGHYDLPGLWFNVSELHVLREAVAGRLKHTPQQYESGSDYNGSTSETGGTT